MPKKFLPLNSKSRYNTSKSKTDFKQSYFSINRVNFQYKMQIYMSKFGFILQGQLIEQWWVGVMGIFNTMIIYPNMFDCTEQIHNAQASMSLTLISFPLVHSSHDSLTAWAGFKL